MGRPTQIVLESRLVSTAGDLELGVPTNLILRGLNLADQATSRPSNPLLQHFQGEGLYLSDSGTPLGNGKRDVFSLIGGGPGWLPAPVAGQSVNPNPEPPVRTAESPVTMTLPFSATELAGTRTTFLGTSGRMLLEVEVYKAPTGYRYINVFSDFVGFQPFRKVEIVDRGQGRPAQTTTTVVDKATNRIVYIETVDPTYSYTRTLQIGEVARTPQNEPLFSYEKRVRFAEPALETCLSETLTIFGVHPLGLTAVPESSRQTTWPPVIEIRRDEFSHVAVPQNTRLTLRDVGSANLISSVDIDYVCVPAQVLGVSVPACLQVKTEKNFDPATGVLSSSGTSLTFVGDVLSGANPLPDGIRLVPGNTHARGE